MQDVKDVLFRIADTGTTTVTGTVRYSHLDVPVSGWQLASSVGEKEMDRFNREKEIRETKIDGKEAYLIQGTDANDGHQRLTALILLNTQDVIEITLMTDRGYLARNRDVAYAIVNSYQFVPQSVSGRHIKGAFSFKCGDGSLLWIGDFRTTQISNAFVVAGPTSQGDRGALLIVGQVKTTRFADIFHKEFFTTPEFDTELHIAGRTYPAHAIGMNNGEGEGISQVLLFKQGGKDYLLEIRRSSPEFRDIDATHLHEDAVIRHDLDTYFYIDE